MAADSWKTFESLPLEMSLWVNDVCKRFEATWKDGRCPRIEDCLDNAQESARSVLLRELILLDIAYRRQQGETPEIEDYRSQFPTAPLDWLARALPGPLWAGRYQLAGEIARGGMGVVYRAFDPALDRVVAIKVLHENLCDSAEAKPRFLKEAQIAARLQHPYLVPIHERGELLDGRPFLVMKLIEGRTLAELLAERPSPAHDLMRFVQLFGQVCQAVAYAHSRGVIHRDLKPGNVMVGEFGEVQVMDWGLAKILSDRAAEGGSQPSVNGVAEEAVNLKDTPSTDEPGQGTQAGRVLGTYSYIAPEQARGEVDHFDERCDVFGLGAILCEILTGNPPYTGSTREQVRGQAEAADLAPAWARLDDCGADAELVRLAKACLAANREARPRNAQAVAEAVAAYQAAVDQRLRQAERERAAAEVRAREKRRRRWLGVALAAAVLVGVIPWLWMARQQQAQAQEVQQALDLASRQGDEGKWSEAEATLNGMGSLLKTVDATRQHQVKDFLAHVSLVYQLTDIRAGKGDKFDEVDTDAEYAQAFKKYGLDVDKLTATAVADWMHARPKGIARELVATLDDWALERRRQRTEDTDGWQRLLVAAQTADPDSVRHRLRALLVQQDLPALRRFAKDEPDFFTQPVQSLQLLGQLLWEAGDRQAAVNFLRQAQHHYPGDVWINYYLGRYLELSGQPHDALRFLTAAAAMRPELGHDLAHALEEGGNLDEAIAVFRQLIRLRPGNANHHNCLGNALCRKGELEDGIAALRKAIDLRPDFAEPHHNLGLTLVKKKEYASAIVAFREAIRLRPKAAVSYKNLGKALLANNDLDEAEAAFRKAIDLRREYPDAYYHLVRVLEAKKDFPGAITVGQTARRLWPGDALAHYNLGLAYRAKEEWNNAIRAFQEAIRIRPNDAKAYSNLGFALSARKEHNRAIAAYREAIRLRPDYAEAYNNLGVAYKASKESEKAIAAYREAIRLRPDYAEAYNNLGIVYAAKKCFDDAIGAYKEAIRIQPSFAAAHYNLGRAYAALEKWELAIEAFREVVRIRPNDVEAYNELGRAQQNNGNLRAAIAAYRKAIKIQPKDIKARNNLGIALKARGDLEAAITEFQEAIRIKCDVPELHYNLGGALAAKKRFDDAITAYKEAIRLRPYYAKAHRGLGIAYAVIGNLDSAIAAFREAIGFDSEYAEAHYNLGLALRDNGQFAEALVALRRGHDLGQKRLTWSLPSEKELRDCGRLIELDGKLPAILSGETQPANTAEQLELARCCRYKRLYGAAARFYHEVFQAMPELALDREAGHRYHAACAAALSGCGKGQDAANLGEGARARWRQQALNWLYAELNLSAKQLDDLSNPQSRRDVQEMLRAWQRTPNLADVRDPHAIAHLPDAERQAWQQFWVEVDRLLK